MALSKLNPQDRFDVINDEILEQKHLKFQRENNVKNDRAAERQFRDYLAIADAPHTCLLGIHKGRLR